MPVLNVITNQTMTTGIATSIVPAIRPPKNAQAMAPPEPEPSQEGVQT